MTVISLPKQSKGTIHSQVQLSNALDYIMNFEKTDSGKLISSQNILEINNACEEMLLTREIAIATKRQPKKNEILGYHFIQSFSPEDNLTPEQVHEIGIKTMKAYLGESVEFVLATHTDKDHLHNHIVLNATNPKTLKKFQQSQTQFDELKEISDRISAEYGAKIIDRTLKNSHKKYQVYLAQNSYRSEIKQKIKFLMRHATNWADFKNKALVLNLKVEDKGKYTTYEILGTKQQRKIRDRSLKNNALMKDEIINYLKQNEVIYTDEDVKKLWTKQVETKNKSQEKEIEILVEDWEVQKETDKYLYITIDFGIEREATIKVPARCVDKLENGDYQLYIKKQDRFYLIDKNNPEKNRIMMGTTVAKNLKNQSGCIPLYSNNAKVKLKQIFNEFDFLISKGLDFDKSFETIGADLKKTYYETENILDQLEQKILKYVETNKTYARPNTQIIQTIKNLQQEYDDLKQNLNTIEKDILFYDKSVQRYEDYEQRQTKKQNRPRL